MRLGTSCALLERAERIGVPSVWEKFEVEFATGDWGVIGWIGVCESLVGLGSESKNLSGTSSAGLENLEFKVNTV